MTSFRIGRWRAVRGTALSLLSVTALAACSAHFPVNQRATGAALPPQPQVAANDPETLLVVTFSGGGVRASALSYGVLEALSKSPETAGQGPRLLDEVDLISSVSGGSLTAAYYGLYGDATFPRFREDFLERDLQGTLAWRLFWPSNWTKLFSLRYGRSDLVASFLDEKLFHNATLGQLLLRPGPEIQINATDLTQASFFSFIPEQFERLCSDFASYPVSRAVVASSALPVVVTSVVVHNYGEACPQTLPPWATKALAEGVEDEETERARALASYQDEKQRPYIQLLDGGLTDNLGLRAAVDRLRYPEPGSRYDLAKVRRLAFIVVNAESGPDERLDQQDRPLTFAESVGAATDVPLLRYNRQSLRDLSRWLQTQRDIRARCKTCPALETYMVQVRFADVAEPALRDRLRRMSTFLGLGDDGVDLLSQTAERLLQQSQDYQRLLTDLAARPARKR